ncbi:Rha family transcriptional regulator [Clostridium sp. WILCCON 0269]|uniref:Rha family transcriptional regulator n=1 Tax=Candidatus Clostridium eludens TaxID=3381663 RepID=A0ABW8SH50_9CLOT
MLNLNALIPEKITLSSREVALMVDKRHDHLIRDIETYMKQMEEANKTLTPNLGAVNEEPSILRNHINPKGYFIKSSYKDSTGKKNRCYKITKMGCDFIAHKMTGVKGTAFTAGYIKKFYEMESKLKLELQTKEDFKEMTAAIKQVKENPKPYNFSNEVNMINKIALGRTSKQFKIQNNILEKDNIGKYLSYEQLQLIDILQKLNASMILLQMDYEERKARLQDYRLKLAA